MTSAFLRSTTLALTIIVFAANGLAAKAQADVKTRPRPTILQANRKRVPRARSWSKIKSRAPETVATARTKRETIQ